LVIDLKIIQKIKSATVAIGIVDKGKLFPKEIIGSGFLFDPSGYLITAGHVAERCVKVAKEYVANNTPVEMVTFRAITGKSINFVVDVIERFSVLDLVKIPQGYTGPTDLDIACGKPKTKHSGLPFLEINPSCEYPIAEEILMCGYPRGVHALSLTSGKLSGMRFSPILQFGKIAGLLPWDEDTTPYALQTDIVGTGGSSGSPILDHDGKVIAVAQKIIPSSVLDATDKIIGEAKVGITYGVTSCTFNNFVESTKKYYDTGIDTTSIIPLTTLTFVNFTKL